MPLTPSQLLATLHRLPDTGHYLVAFSGGRDSHVLLHLMAALRDRIQARLSAAHIDHGLQPDAQLWAEHCRLVCSELRVPYQSLRLALTSARGESTEARAREARYRALESLMDPGDILLTAHHQGDQAETVLLQLLRGAGPSGLAAMPLLAGFGSGLHGRPLLAHPGDELARYAAEHELTWVEDPSNRNIGFDRNYLRNRVIPLLLARWPAMGRTLSRSARHCAEAQALVERVAQRDLGRLLDIRTGGLILSRLAALDPPRGRAALRAWIRDSGFRVPDAARLERTLREMTAAGSGRHPMVHWDGVEVRRYRDRLHIMSALAPLNSGRVLEWDGRTPLELPAGLGRLQAAVGAGGVSLRCWREHRIQVRFGHPAGRITVAGRPHSQSFKNFFQQQGVPSWSRSRIPLIYLGDRLAALGDLCVCQPFAAQPGEAGVQAIWIRPPGLLPGRTSAPV